MLYTIRTVHYISSTHRKRMLIIFVGKQTDTRWKYLLTFELLGVGDISFYENRAIWAEFFFDFFQGFLSACYVCNCDSLKKIFFKKTIRVNYLVGLENINNY